MSLQYPKKILIELSIRMIVATFVVIAHSKHTLALEAFETITFKDELGQEHEEYAFEAPLKGVPQHILDLHCANTKLRLYWSVFRPEIKESKRKGIFLRRIARLSRHIFSEVRLADKPFNATQLSVMDEYFAIRDEENSKKESDDEEDYEQAKVSVESKGELGGEKRWYHTSKHSKSSKTNYRSKELSPSAPKGHVEQLKQFVRKHAPKVGMGIYTRWRTMWWLMMPCLFTKYYLWDPALDEYTKLQRSLVMYPDFLMLKMQEINCPPLNLFKRILDVCKLLNPLLNFNFGQLSLDKTIAPGAII